MLNLALKPSPRLLIIIIGLHSLALIMIWFSALPIILCVVIDALVIVSAYGQVRDHWLVGNRQLSFNEGRWTLVHRGQVLPVALKSEFYFSPWMIVLAFRQVDDSKQSGKWGKNHFLLILPDCVSADEWRLLRVFLKSMPQAAL